MSSIFQYRKSSWHLVHMPIIYLMQDHLAFEAVCQMLPLNPVGHILDYPRIDGLVRKAE